MCCGKPCTILLLGATIITTSETGKSSGKTKRADDKEEKESAENKENDEVDVPEWLEIWDSKQSTFYYYKAPVHGRKIREETDES